MARGGGAAGEARRASGGSSDGRWRVSGGEHFFAGFEHGWACISGGMRCLWLAASLCVLLAVVGPEVVLAKKAAAAAPAPPAPAAKSGSDSAKIEEVTAKQLEKYLLDKDYVAVFWCEYRKKSHTPKKKKSVQGRQPGGQGRAPRCVPFDGAAGEVRAARSLRACRYF